MNFDEIKEKIEQDFDLGMEYVNSLNNPKIFFESITHLYFSGHDMESSPDLTDFENLNYLDFSGCENLFDVSGLSDCNNDYFTFFR
jgi:hypothetical protein